MLKLYSVVLGGRAEGCNIELHDVVFVIGESIEQVYPALVKKWFGTTKRLHLDSYIELTHADNHDIILSKNAPSNTKKLFFVNFGAYKPNYFGEVHETAFYVANTKSEVLARAKSELLLDGIEPHCDDNVVVDDVMEVTQIDQYYLHLQHAQPKQMTIVSDYRPLHMYA